MNKNRVIVAVIASLTALSSFSSYAASPRFARTDEEWAKLEDNVLEYEEIDGLVHEYNLKVLENDKAYNDFIKKYGKTREDIADKYREIADDLEDSMTGEDGMGLITDYNLQLQADNLRDQADDNLEDSYIYHQQYSSEEANIVKDVKAKFIEYYTSQIDLEIANYTLQKLNIALDTVTSKYNYGVAVKSDILAAQEAVLKQEKTVEELKQSIEKARQDLIISCGWSATAYPEIRQVPEFNAEMADVIIGAIDVNADAEEAIANNYTLKINQRKFENASYGDNKDLLDKTIADNKIRIRASIDTSYKNLQTSYRVYLQGIADSETLARETQQINEKYSLGLVTLRDVENQEIAVKIQDLTNHKNLLQLFNSYESYIADVNGTASAN